MGFDLSGLSATSKKGEYFRNNVWWWRPLASYVVEVCSLDEEGWFFNDGKEVGEDTALKIADKLDELLASGEVARYSRQYAADLKKLPLIECDLCKGAGTRNDQYVQGVCNGCAGTGKVKQFSTNYPFSVENVRDFSRFCRESGGFAIY